MFVEYHYALFIEINQIFQRLAAVHNQALDKL